jgi:hypothetical protein
MSFINLIYAKGSAISIGKEPNSCLGQVFNFKLDSFASYQHKSAEILRSILKWNTRPRVSPVANVIKLFFDEIMMVSA